MTQPLITASLVLGIIAVCLVFEIARKCWPAG